MQQLFSLCVLFASMWFIYTVVCTQPGRNRVLFYGTLHETTAVRLFASHLGNYPGKTNKTCGKLLEKQWQTSKWPFLWTSTQGRASVGRPARTYLHQLCVNTGYNLEDLPGEMDNRNGGGEREREREGGKSVLSSRLDDDDEWLLNHG